VSNVPWADLGKPAGRISTQSRRRLGLLEALAPQVLRHAASRAPRSLLDALRDGLLRRADVDDGDADPREASPHLLEDSGEP